MKAKRMSVEAFHFCKPACRRAAKVIVAPALLALATLMPAGASAQPAAPQSAEGPSAGEIVLEVSRFEVTGNNPLSASETEALLAPHLGAHRSLATIEAAALALEEVMRERGYSFHRVIVPSQKPAQGVVRLDVLQFPLAAVNVAGNAHFSSDNIRASLPGFAAGTSPDVRQLSRDVGLANEHPSKRLTIVLRESTQADALDAEIRVRDLSPSTFFAGLSGGTRDAYDQINENTGYTRLTLGYQHSNLFDRDHAVTATYTTSPEHPSTVSQYGVFYWLPLYGYATSAQFYYSHSDIDTGAIGLGASSFSISGKGRFLGARVTHSLARFRELTHNVSVAVDDKLFESDVAVLGSSFGPTESRSRPLSMRYAARSDQVWGGGGGEVEYLRNLPGGKANDDTSYDLARAGATRNWQAFRAGFDAAYGVGQWILSARTRGQYSRDQLIPGEQFGLGGTASVRGLRDREFTGDVGWSLSVEAKGPPLVSTLQPVVFCDFGHARLRGAAVLQGTTVNSESASSVGAGVRWSMERTLDLTVDVARVMNGIASGAVSGSERGDLKLMFAGFYRY
jgi:hemolysin activation/secretion protein